VCVALAQAWDIDVTFLRLAFLLLALAWGLGVIVYLAMWLVLPPTDGGSGPRRMRGIWGDVRGTSRRLATAWGRAGNRTAGPFPLTRRWMGLGLVFGGFFVVLGSVGLLAWITPARALGLATMAVGAAIVGSLGGGVRSDQW
jgi:phage shock protein PspC (stress-responsive transcriptional regulator)